MGFRPDGHQVERHGRTHSMASSSNSRSGRSHGGIRSGCSRQPVLFWSGNIAGRGGTGLVVIGGVVEMDDEFVFTMDSPVDRNYLRFIIRGQGEETGNGRQYLRTVENRALLKYIV